ncbi:hypothetical protein OUZ56_004307 [Daphnia magna]|uniref:Uncharacterized protein n=1 Tax=Daphnia magna TaxID=35525 RepID=A0ABQ9YPE4_9CRUS|nr:hypothetical protein OUZ56_004307 [Daphnia magna]
MITDFLNNDTFLASRHPMFLVPRSRKIFPIQEFSKESPQLQIKRLLLATRIGTADGTADISRLWGVPDVLWWPQNHSMTWFNPGLGFFNSGLQFLFAEILEAPDVFH